ncbi:MAG TPA: cytochrome c [Verrucomicrobiae bacterium]
MSEDNKSCSCSAPSANEPTATRSTVPMWILVITLLFVFLGLVYFDKQSAWFDAKVYAPYGNADQLQNSQPMSAALVHKNNGKKFYEMYCGSCHGNDGMGKVGQAPPLAGSELVIAKGFHRLSMIPLEGLAGPIKVKGQDWNLNMAAMGAALSDSDLADVMTYIRGSWGNDACDVSADDIKAIRAEIGRNPQQIPGDKLMTMPE